MLLSAIKTQIFSPQADYNTFIDAAGVDKKYFWANKLTSKEAKKMISGDFKKDHL